MKIRSKPQENATVIKIIRPVRIKKQRNILFFITLIELLIILLKFNNYI